MTTIFKFRYMTAQFLGVIALSPAMIVGTVGCTSAQINNVVTIITNDLPTVVSDITSILSLVNALETADGSTSTTTTIETIQDKTNDLTNILTAYKDGTKKWADVVSAVNALYSASSSTLDLSGIKDSASKAKATAWLAAIDVAVNAIYTAVLTTESNSSVKNQLSVQKARLSAKNWTPEQKSQFVAQLEPITGIHSWNGLMKF
jgi:hypothetical protein